MLNDAELKAFRTRCMKAANYGYTVARSALYQAALEEEAGSVDSPDHKKGSARHLVALADAVLKVRAGGKKAPKKAKAKPAAPPPAPEPPAAAEEPEVVEVEEEVVKPYKEWLKAELYAEAEAREIEGRSSMTKAELVEALEADDAANDPAES